MLTREHKGFIGQSQHILFYYKIKQRWRKGNKDEQKSKLKTNDIKMNIFSFLLFKLKQMVWIYTSSTLSL